MNQQHHVVETSNTKDVTKPARRSVKGQGLVEYALILALVSVVVIGIAFALGLAVQRAYGLVVGSLGQNAATSADNRYIRITNVICQGQQSAFGGQGLVGIEIRFVTNIPNPNDSVAVHTTRTANTAWDATGNGVIDVRPFTQSGSSWIWNPLIMERSADTGLCPNAVMLVTNDGKVAAVSPVNISLVN